MDKESVSQTQTASQSVLTFEQKKELLLLQMEHDKMKQQSEKGRIELEKAKMKVEMLKLRLIKEGKGVVSSDEEHRGTFTLNSNLKLARKFNEEDPDIFFTFFERIADLQDWSEENCVLLLQCVLTGKAHLVFSALSIEDCQSYEKINQQC